ncbi:sensor histidine kinase [Rhizobium rhizogenes]|uniref:sensor histidine kinase n=1 Tax=Rhizobium rhizogenes TaxID=359 RepID=UPI001571EB63|nr:sensor histidine kinase [Rhizobium rhizogenes]NTH21823.1 sensor histidine kinase [Rhizobium rhizogenes]NTH34966.1 sensor histidine kinase [Rhizobium rhizogenes]
MGIKLFICELGRSIRVRILGLVAGVLGGGAVILGCLAYFAANTAAEEAYDRLLGNGAVQFAENVFVQGGVVTLDPPASAISGLAAYDLIFYRVVDPRGIVVAGNEDLSSKAPPRDTQKELVFEDGVYADEPVRMATISKEIENPAVSGWAEITVAQTIHARTALARRLTYEALGVIAVMFLLAVSATTLSLRFALKPLIEIEQEIQSRDPDDLSPIHAEPPVEIRNLVQSIDEFMRRLSGRMAMFQRFIGDAAHQMRTPLAALDAQVEMLSYARSDAAINEAIARIRERNNELGRLTGQLLDHAMILHRSDLSRIDPVDINELVRLVMSKVVPLSMSREIEISFTPASPEIVLSIDPVSVREAISNLINNALAHGATSRLEVEVKPLATGVGIIIRDDGDGFEANPQSLLAPFEKGPRSRGSGLGLTIASEVAKAHNGSLHFRRENDFTVVQLTLAAS